VRGARSRALESSASELSALHVKCRDEQRRLVLADAVLLLDLGDSAWRGAPALSSSRNRALGTVGDSLAYIPPAYEDESYLTVLALASHLASSPSTSASSPLHPHDSDD
jgi:hypothetical protein